MIILKNDSQIESIRRSCLIVCGALTEVAKVIGPGVTGAQIDKLAEEYIRDQSAVPAFKGHGGFPGSLCISINSCVVHGIPSEEPFKEGDIVSVDCGSILDGFYGDSAYTFAVGEISDDLKKLLDTTNESLYIGIDQARVGNRIGDIGFAIQDYTERKHDYSVVRELVGHGIGENLHEPPEVPNYGKRGKGPKIEEGLVIAIEPMINLGKKNIMQLNDGWSIVTRDNMPSAHFEHTIAVKKEGPVLLSDHEPVVEAIKNNENLSHFSVKS
ncbi:MAG: type I methionyl aminopeptidase [Saprospiraceae bacterium]|nr:type I methionyl aminopeptidase [Saprospiraceae bacterium]